MTPKEKIIQSFLAWYENDSHSQNEDYYIDTINESYLSQLPKDEFIEFFYQFAVDGGKIQSKGSRNAPNFRKTILSNYNEFRAKILEPFQSTFDLESWLNWADNFNFFGQGTATIFLNRVDKTQYVVVNNKSIEGLQKLGYDIGSGKLSTVFNSIKQAEQQLLNEFPELDNFYKVDSLTHFLIGTPEGKELIKEHYAMDFFTQEELQTLKTWAKVDYEKNNNEHINAFNLLKELYSKTQYWARETVELCFAHGIEKTRKNPINQAQKFEAYQWAKIYPSKKDSREKWLAYTLGINSGGFFDVKIDTVGVKDNEKRRKHYLSYRGEYSDSNIVKNFTFEEILTGGWKELFEKTSAAIELLKPHFTKI